MKRLIVNADDFGFAESVNRGIIVAHREGILTSASLLANGSAFEQGIALADQCPDLSVGVHLNISDGIPISPARSIPTLVNDHGELHLSPLRIWMRILTRQIRLEDVHSEFRAQLLKVSEAGLIPTHLDGHLHVHVLPQLSPIVIGLAREFRIRCVRCPAENLEATLPALWKFGGDGIAALKRSAIAVGVSSLARPLRKRLRVAGLISPNTFYGLAQTGFLDVKMLSALLHLVPDGTTELMCHPGYPSVELETMGGELTRSRQTEVLALTSREIRQTTERLGIRLTNFRHLEETLPG